jgi:hypothetical protein
MLSVHKGNVWHRQSKVHDSHVTSDVTVRDYLGNHYDITVNEVEVLVVLMDLISSGKASFIQ